MVEMLDLRGLSCPLPLIKTKQGLENRSELTVVVDETVAKENILKFAKSQNYEAECTAAGEDFSITTRK